MALLDRLSRRSLQRPRNVLGRRAWLFFDGTLAAGGARGFALDGAGRRWTALDGSTLPSGICPIRAAGAPFRVGRGPFCSGSRGNGVENRAGSVAPGAEMRDLAVEKRSACSKEVGAGGLSAGAIVRVTYSKEDPA